MQDEKQDYEPGQVAIIRVPRGTTPGGLADMRSARECVDVRVVRTVDGGWMLLEDTSFVWPSDYAFYDAPPRLVAVIDYEDDDLLGRLLETLRLFGLAPHLDEFNLSPHLRSLRAALRACAGSRIEEPGHWGVVEAGRSDDPDAPRVHWVRHSDGYWHDSRGTHAGWMSLLRPTLVREGWLRKEVEA